MENISDLAIYIAQNAALSARVQELADEVSLLTEQRDGLLDLLEATVQYTTNILEAI
jgi:cell division protein FtsB